jgi:hypothetical protein
MNHYPGFFLFGEILWNIHYSNGLSASRNVYPSQKR